MNLNNTGLTVIHMLEIGTALRRSRSLRSLHLCGNEINMLLIHKLIKITHGFMVI